MRSSFSGIEIDGVATGFDDLNRLRSWPGTGLPSEIASRAKKLGYQGYAITDFNTLSSQIRSWQSAREHGLRSLIAAEIALPALSPTDSGEPLDQKTESTLIESLEDPCLRQELHPFYKSNVVSLRNQRVGNQIPRTYTLDSDRGHVLFHVINAKGYQNLCTVLTASRQGHAKGVIHYSLDTIFEHHEGLFATLLPGHHTSISKWKDVFGERLSLAFYQHATPLDPWIRRWCIQNSKRFEIPLLATLRPMLLDRSDKDFHDTLTCIRQNILLHEAGQRLLPNDEAYLRSPERAEIFFRDHGIWSGVLRSRKIFDRCTFGYDDLKYDFPCSLPRGTSAHKFLVQEVLRGACQRYEVSSFEECPTSVIRQVQHELQIIRELNVAAYFLTVKEIVDIARDRNILYQGRGSAANSLVCYVLGITAVDPVERGLLFERFLSKERQEPPDIDVDFEHERREEVIQAIYERFGREHAAMVCNVIRFRGRSAIRAVAKTLGFHDLQCTQLTKGLWSSSSGFNDSAVEELGYTPQDPKIQRLLHHSQRLMNHPNHLGIHSGGFILSRAPIASLAPVEPARMQGRTVVPFDKDDIESVAWFKMDILALGMLTCIRKAFDLIEGNYGLKHKLYELPMEDVKTFDALCNADTIGVFQVESRAQMSMLPRLRPRRFYDLVVQVALVRPGPIQGGMVHPYLRRRAGREAVVYPHKDLIPILERTLGVPIFQEQAMRIAMTGAGYSAGEADQLRRDMAAWKKHGNLERHRNKLIHGMLKKGITRHFAESLFQQLHGFADYGFPESHAASFALLAYASAWLKTNYPAAFCVALLNSQPLGFYAPAQIVSDAQMHGVEVCGLDIRSSTWDHQLRTRSERSKVGDSQIPVTEARRNDFKSRFQRSSQSDQSARIELGFRLVKGLRKESILKIEEERNKRAFASFLDFQQRIALSQKERVVLAKSGAFDSWFNHRREAIWGALHNQLPLFPQVDDRPRLEEASPEEVLMMSRRSLGLCLNDHVMKYWRPRLDGLRQFQKSLLTSGALRAMKSRRKVRFAGLVIGRQRPHTASGTWFVSLEDEEGIMNVIVWKSLGEEFRKEMLRSTVMVVEGRLEFAEGVQHLIATTIWNGEDVLRGGLRVRGERRNLRGNQHRASGEKHEAHLDQGSSQHYLKTLPKLNCFDRGVWHGVQRRR